MVKKKVNRKANPLGRTKKKQVIEVMTVEMYKKEETPIDPRRLIQLVFDFYTMPLE